MVILLVWLPLAIASTILRSWVVTVLWRWFVVGLFGLQPLSISMAFGLITLVHLVTRDCLMRKEKLTHEESARIIFKDFCGSLTGLGMGWAAHIVV